MFSNAPQMCVRLKRYAIMDRTYRMMALRRQLASANPSAWARPKPSGANGRLSGVEKPSNNLEDVRNISRLIDLP